MSNDTLQKAAALETMALPPHEPTIAIEEILSEFGGESRIDIWESIQAYADNHARRALLSINPVITVIGDEIHANKIAHGWKVTTIDAWKDQHEIPAILMLITTEVVEAMEAFRKDDFEHFKEEMADIAIRTIGLSHGLGFDLLEEILKKMAKNRTREYKHGGKRI